jgi:hypothetical protein
MPACAPSGLHPVLGGQAPLTLTLGHADHGVQYTVCCTNGGPMANYAGLPADLQEAGKRRAGRIAVWRGAAEQAPADGQNRARLLARLTAIAWIDGTVERFEGWGTTYRVLDPCSARIISFNLIADSDYSITDMASYAPKWHFHDPCGLCAKSSCGSAAATSGREGVLALHSNILVRMRLNF